MPRFVVLRHHTPDGAHHYDWLLERPEGSSGEGLITFRMAIRPGESERGEGAEGERLEDHREVYLDYEGPLTGGRGWVERTDVGVVRITREVNEGIRFETELAGRPQCWEWRVGPQAAPREPEASAGGCDRLVTGPGVLFRLE